jgi:hypothetical protein
LAVAADLDARQADGAGQLAVRRATLAISAVCMPLIRVCAVLRGGAWGEGGAVPLAEGAAGYEWCLVVLALRSWRRFFYTKIG